MGHWRERMLSSTRGRVVLLLRRAALTVNDLAEALALTPNAVRLHVAALERDGLVEQHGTRSEWTGKPAALYRTTSAAEALFPKPYARVLAELMSSYQRRRSEAELREVLREIGARVAAGRPPGPAGVRERVEYAATVLNEMGGDTEVIDEGASLRIQGYGCPLGEVTADVPAACQLAESLVAALVGASVTECCDRGERPRCAFRIAAA